MSGGSLAGYSAEGDKLPFGSKFVEAATRGSEDRNRTAPFPFCGNRFEFRAVGSSQNVAQPMAYLNTMAAAGLASVSDKIEAGASPRDAVAATFSENARVIFNGNGYSDEWPVEAASRGLLNLPNTPVALSYFDSDKNKKLFTTQGVFTEAEVVARKNVMLDEYINQLLIEAETALNMANRDYLPACAADMSSYSGSAAVLAGDRAAVYGTVALETQGLADALAKVPSGGNQETAEYFNDTVKPAMATLREAVDAAEGLCESSKWPMATYGELLFHHHQHPEA